MKKLYSFILSIFVAAFMSAQISITQNAGVVNFYYGWNNDWSLYDPHGASTIWVHVWINAPESTANTTYDDAWSNSTVSLTYNNSTHQFEGTLDLNTKLFTNSNNTVPAGTTVNEVNFIFKDQQNGATNKSEDLKATVYGFTPTTLKTKNLSTFDVAALAKKSVVVAGNLYTAQTGNLNIQIFDFSGKLMKTMNVKANEAPIAINLAQKGLYIMRVSNGAKVETIKFAY